MNAGKRFELDFKASVPNDVWFYRFRDSPANFTNKSCEKCPINKQKPIRFTTRNICDCEIFKMPNLFLLELKTTKNKSLPFSMVLDNQVKQLTEADRHKGIVAGFIVNFREVGDTFFLPIAGYNYYKETLTSKSIPLKIFKENCYKIGQTKKKVHYSYDVGLFLAEITNYEAKIKQQNKSLFD